MSFVSYAQNFEDVMLWRALKHVENGFYIDIGAQDPLVDSVSKAFYEHGWRGCHIEPTNQYSAKLKNARPDELVLQLAVGNGGSSLTFFEIENTGLSTSDKSIAMEHEARGFKFSQTTVPLISLDSLFDRFGDRDVHWLKIDVEGAEKSVLESWQVSTVRPWVLVIESTKPMTQEECYDDWEPLVLAKGYRFVYFDGLNRFYVAGEHAELVAAFRNPPNIFDDFVLSGLASQPFYRQYKAQSEARVQQADAKSQQAEALAQQAEIKAQQAEIKAQYAEARAQQAEARAKHAENLAQHWQMQVNEWHERILAIYASTSWRITKPLRAFKRLLSGDFAGVGRKITSSCLGFVFRRPALRKVFSWCLKRFPPLHRKLLHVAVISGVVQGGESPAILSDAGAGDVENEQIERPILNVGAYRIYMQLIKAAQDKHGVGQ